MGGNIYIYIAVMALVTYLIRMLPLVLVKKKIKNRFLISFLYYIPYSVLAVMTIPAMFTASETVISASLGFVCAFILAYKNKSLVTVAAFSCLTVLVVETIIKYL